jgi:hypothetical protein
VKRSVFRKKNLDKVFSPEQLNDYIKVSNPSIWIVLAAVIILLIALFAWAFFGMIPGTNEVAISFIIN